MNDEDEAEATPVSPRPRESAAVSAVRWICVGTAVIVGVYFAAMFLWPVPEGTHCSLAEGNATCVEYYGGNRPYCTSPKYNVQELGCVVKPPPEEMAKPCGPRKERPPDDPTCSQVVVDNPPDPEFLEKFERREIVPYIVLCGLPGLAFAACIVLIVIERRRERVQALRKRRAQQAGRGGLRS